MSEKDKFCRDVGCRLPGHWKVSESNGERVVCTNARHGHEKHVATFNLAEETVALIKRDKKFADYFNRLMAA